MLSFWAAKAAKAAEATKRKREEVAPQSKGQPAVAEEELEDEQPLQRHRSADLPVSTLPPDSPVPTATPVVTAASSSKSQGKCPDLQRSGVEELVGRQPEILLDFLRAPSPARKSGAAFPSPLRESAVLLS